MPLHDRLDRLEREAARLPMPSTEMARLHEEWADALTARMEGLVLACPDDLQDAVATSLCAALDAFEEGAVGQAGHGLFHWAQALVRDRRPAPARVPREVVLAYLDHPSRGCHCECGSCGARLPGEASGAAVFERCPWCGGGPVSTMAWWGATHDALRRLNGAGLVRYPGYGPSAEEVMRAHGFRPGEQTLAQWEAGLPVGGPT